MADIFPPVKQEQWAAFEAGLTTRQRRARVYGWVMKISALFSHSFPDEDRAAAFN